MLLCLFKFHIVKSLTELSVMTPKSYTLDLLPLKQNLLVIILFYDLHYTIKHLYNFFFPAVIGYSICCLTPILQIHRHWPWEIWGASQQRLERGVKSRNVWDFSGLPVVKTLGFQWKDFRFNTQLKNYDPTCHVDPSKINK